MKLKYLFAGLVASTVMLSSCVEVDQLVPLDGVGSQQLTVKGFLVDGYTAEIPSAIDHESHTITVKVPYYISDTDPIMGDITQMKLEATTPVGYCFSPSISGIHDLSVPFHTNLVDAKGKATPYTIIAVPTYSDAAKVLSGKLVQNERVPVVVQDPASPGEHGTIVILRMSSAVDDILNEVQMQVSPWSTVECTGYDSATGNFDLSAMPQIIVTAQDGVTKTIYDVKYQTPQLLDKGVGYITALFGMQFYTDNDLGLTAGNHSTLAVIDDYVILSNHSDVSNMIVLDRYTGRKVEGVKVNTTGMPTDREFRAICHDDANHLIAISFTCSANFTTDPNVRMFIWKDGIQNPPTSVLWANINGSYFSAGSSWAAREMFYNINCRGDIVNGEAVVASCSLQSYRCWLMPFKNGQTNGNCIVEYAGGIVSMWAASNCAPTTATPPYGYVWHTGNFRATTIYCPAGTAAGRAFDFNKPTFHYWGANTHGVDYIEFNGSNLIAVSDGNIADGSTNNQRIYVADVGASPTASSLADGYLFDSREGNKLGDANNGGPAGTGYGVTGMTAGSSFESGKTVLGNNFFSINRAVGDIKFARDPSGNAVQVYMLTPDQGLIAYEITRYDI